MNAPQIARNRAVKTGNFVVKTENENGTTTWIDSESMEEITLHSDSAPTPEILRNMAANGVVPLRPTLDSLEQGDSAGFEEFAMEDEDDSPLARLMTKIGSENVERSEVKVYKKNSDGSESYCAKFTVAEYADHGEELIRAHFGGGKFVVHVYGPGPSWPGNPKAKFVRLAKSEVEIISSAVPLKTPGADNSGVPVAMIQILQTMAGEIAALKNQPQGGLGNLAETLTTLKTLGLLPNPNQKAPSALDQIRDMEAMLGLRKKIEEARDDSGGGDGKEDSMLSIAGKVLEVVTSRNANLQAPAAPQMGAYPANGAVPMLEIPQSFKTPDASYVCPQCGPDARGADEHARLFHTMENDEMNTGETFGAAVMIGAILKSAHRQEPVESWAAWCADKLPDEALDALESPGWYDALSETFPQFAEQMEKHRVWLTQMRARTIEILNTPDEETPAPVAKTARVKK